MNTWHALNTKPGAERLVREVLTSRGLESYLPLWSPGASRPLQPRSVQPYFPSYLFARCDLDVVGISALQFLPGVRRLLFYGDRPATINDRVIEELQKRLALLQSEIDETQHNPFKPGQRVVITEGVFSGYEALFDRRLSSGARSRVLVDFLQKRVPVEMDTAFLRPVRSLAGGAS